MNWCLITHKQYPIFSRNWILEAFRDDMKKALGVGFNNYKSLYNGIYYDEGEFSNLKRLLVNDFNKDINLIFGFFKNWKKECDDLLKLTANINIDELKGKESKDLILSLKRYIDGFKRSAAYIFLPHVFEVHLEGWLREFLNQKDIDEKKKKHYFFILTCPIRSTFLEDSKKDFTKLIETIRGRGIKAFLEDEGILEEIKKYTNKYKWLGYDTGIGYDLSMEDTIERIKNTIKRGFKESGFDRTGIKQEFENIIKELKPNENERKRIQLIDEVIFITNYRAECHSIAGLNIKPILEELANRLRITYEDIINLTLDEIVDSIKNGKVDSNIICQRKEKYGLLMINGKISIYSGEEVRKIEEESIIDKEIKEFGGLVANEGCVRSTVKIVTTLKDMDKVQPGDIIVSKLTTPDFIVAIERCIGIITDAGGIASHAAIVARELGKPCITGTKIATKVLQDGDNGIVRIIKKNEQRH